MVPFEKKKLVKGGNPSCWLKSRTQGISCIGNKPQQPVGLFVNQKGRIM